MSNINLHENYGGKSLRGEVEIIVKDRNGNIINRIVEKNIIKLFGKEILSHRLAPDKVWDSTSGSGGEWVTHDIDLAEFAARYIVFGASFDDDGNPLDTADTRYYVSDSTIGGYVPIALGPGAEYDGGLINPVPISEPDRPLKRVERIYYESSYQPAGTPLLQDDVRAINNVLVLETTLPKEEYNGLGVTANDYMTITEVALVAAAEVGSVGTCECDPRSIFLTASDDGDAYLASASGASTISLDLSEDADVIYEGDQIKIVASGETAGSEDILGQVNPYYLVVSKAIGGRDITLDRTPVDSDNNEITGAIGVLRDGFRIFSHRILSNPVKKNADTELIIRWRITMN